MCLEMGVLIDGDEELRCAVPSFQMKSVYRKTIVHKKEAFPFHISQLTMITKSSPAVYS
jgi:hypothetical protein